MSVRETYGADVRSRAPLLTPGVQRNFKTWSSFDAEPHTMGGSPINPIADAVGRFVNLAIGVISVSFIAVGIGVLIAYARHILNS